MQLEEETKKIKSDTPVPSHAKTVLERAQALLQRSKAMRMQVKPKCPVCCDTSHCLSKVLDTQKGIISFSCNSFPVHINAEAFSTVCRSCARLSWTLQDRGRAVGEPSTDTGRNGKILAVACCLGYMSCSDVEKASSEVYASFETTRESTSNVVSAAAELLSAFDKDPVIRNALVRLKNLRLACDTSLDNQIVCVVWE